MEAVDVFAHVDGVDHRVGVDAVGEGELDEDAVHVVAGVEAGHVLEERGLADVGGETMERPADPRLGGGLLLVAGVDDARRILAHQHDVQAGGASVLLHEGGDVVGDARPELLRFRFAIDELRNHGARTIAWAP